MSSFGKVTGKTSFMNYSGQWSIFVPPCICIYKIKMQIYINHLHVLC